MLCNQFRHTASQDIWKFYINLHPVTSVFLASNDCSKTRKVISEYRRGILICERTCTTHHCTASIPYHKIMPMPMHYFAKNANVNALLFFYIYKLANATANANAPNRV